MGEHLNYLFDESQLELIKLGTDLGVRIYYMFSTIFYWLNICHIQYCIIVDNTGYDKCDKRAETKVTPS